MTTELPRLWMTGLRTGWVCIWKQKGRSLAAGGLGKSGDFFPTWQGPLGSWAGLVHSLALSGIKPAFSSWPCFCHRETGPSPVLLQAQALLTEDLGCTGAECTHWVCGVVVCVCVYICTCVWYVCVVCACVYVCMYICVWCVVSWEYGVGKGCIQLSVYICVA